MVVVYGSESYGVRLGRRQATQPLAELHADGSPDSNPSANTVTDTEAANS